MSVSPAPARRTFGPAPRVPGECAQCGAPLEIARNRVNLKNYCRPCRKAADAEWSRAQQAKPEYRANHYAREAERRRIARELKARPVFPPAPGRPGWVMAPCSECSTPVETVSFRAGQRRLCDACRDAIKSRTSAARYARQAAAKRAAQPVVNMPNRAHHNYARPLTLLSVPDDSWPAGGTLALEAWLPLVEAGDLAGAQWRDPGGARYTAAAGQIVRVTP